MSNHVRDSSNHVDVSPRSAGNRLRGPWPRGRAIFFAWLLVWLFIWWGVVFGGWQLLGLWLFLGWFLLGWFVFGRR
jgi:hypothetical protein